MMDEPQAQAAMLPFPVAGSLAAPSRRTVAHDARFAMLDAERELDADVRLLL